MSEASNCRLLDYKVDYKDYSSFSDECMTIKELDIDFVENHLFPLESIFSFGRLLSETCRNCGPRSKRKTYFSKVPQLFCLSTTHNYLYHTLPLLQLAKYVYFPQYHSILRLFNLRDKTKCIF